jgi:hypothetical protein|tara:strand:- start:267 stop:527 length:261 start_codon:yes stop_codon:yes gene_type:complete
MNFPLSFFPYNIQYNTNTMPIKFKPSQTSYVKGQNKKITSHFYIKQTPKEELVKYINEGQKPKIKLKCRNELDRRGVKINWIPKEA